MPRTMEQVKLCRERGIGRIAVFMAKCDLADDEDLQGLVSYDITEVLEKKGYSDDYPFEKGSAKRAYDWSQEEDKKLFFRFLGKIHRMK